MQRRNSVKSTALPAFAFAALCLLAVGATGAAQRSAGGAGDDPIPVPGVEVAFVNAAA